VNGTPAEPQSFLSPLIWAAALLAAAVFIFIEQASQL